MSDTDLSALPQPVRDLVRKADKWKRGDRTWELIRAELLRLQEENAALTEQVDYAGRLYDTAQAERERAESELAALRKRVANTVAEIDSALNGERPA